MRLLATLGIAVAMVAHADEAPLTPQDFMRGITLETDRAHGLYEIAVPLDVYRGVTRADLGDLRVFNARGEVVPHAIMDTPAESPPPETRPLPFFAITTAAKRAETLSLSVRTRPDGSILDVHGNARTSDAGRVVAWLLDASQLHAPLAGLDLDWQAPSEGVFTQLDVEASNDLKSWQRVAEGAVVASLRRGEEQLEHRRIELGIRQSKYFRLTSPAEQTPIALTKVTAVLALAMPPAPPVWVAIAVTPGDESGQYHLDLAGPLPVERVRFGFVQPNVVAEVELLARADTEQTWRRRSTGRLYDLQNGTGRLSALELAVNPGTDRFWMLRVREPQSVFGASLPRLEVGMRPAKLVFVARGDEPFLLAYGSGRARPAAYPLAGLLQELQVRSGAAPTMAMASPGASRNLGGDSALRAPVSVRTWKVWLLWAALGAGVILLAWMVYRLVKQLGASAAPPP